MKKRVICHVTIFMYNKNIFIFTKFVVTTQHIFLHQSCATQILQFSCWVLLPTLSYDKPGTSEGL